MLVLLGVLLTCALVRAQGDAFCRAATTCADCHGRASDAQLPCQWCVMPGITPYAICNGACSDGFIGTPSNQCPVDPNWCSRATDCETCSARIGVAGKQCTWCSSGSGGGSNGDLPLGAGCIDALATCPRNSFPWTCAADQAPTSLQWATFVSSAFLSTASIVVGIVVGGALYFIAVQKEDIDRYFTYCGVLFFLSFVFWGTSIFSLMLSVKTIRAKGFSAVGILLLSVFFEILPIFVGLITGVSIDSSMFHASQYYGTYWPNWIPLSLVITVPLAYAGILGMGTGRMIFTHNRLKGSVHYHPLQSPPLHIQQQYAPFPHQGYGYASQPVFQQPTAAGSDAGLSDSDKY